jgi:hypothetical protein
LATAELDEFVESLPPQLKIWVAIKVHKKTFDNDPFFKKLGNKRLLSFFGQRFRPRHFVFGQYLHRDGEIICTYKVIVKGAAAFMQPEYNNQIYAVVSGEYPELEIKQERLVFTHCGFEDTVMNHILLIQE